VPVARAAFLLAVAALGCTLNGCEDEPGRHAQPERAWPDSMLAGGGRFIVRLDRARPDFTWPGARVTRRFTRLPGVAISADGASMLAMRGDPRVLAIEPDEGGKGLLAEAEPLVGLDQVKAAGFRGAGITVALIDSGVDKSHPALAGRVVDEACFCGSGCCPNGDATQTGADSALDDNGHGTHVAGAIASQGTSSPEGGAPDVQLVAVKVLDSHLDFCCMSDVIAALDWIGSAHPEVKLVNVSLGANSLWMGDCDALYTILSASVNALRLDGALVVAASGNDSTSDAMRSPACISSVLSVGAVWDADVGDQHEYCNEPVTSADRVACYSNASTTTDLLAPGGIITSAWPGGGTQALIGTSHAAPLVTACAADLLAAKPALTPQALESLLEQTGHPLTDPRNGLTYPRLDCKAALDAPLPSADAGAGDDGGTEDDAGTAHDAGRSPLDAAVADAAAPHSGGSEARDAGHAPHPRRDAGGAETNPRADAGRHDAASDRDAALGDAGRGAKATDGSHVARPIRMVSSTGCACSAPGWPLESASDLLSLAAIAVLSRLRRRRR
jgi:subtilisin family serine protease